MFRTERELLDRARDNLMKKLVEVEMDGQAAAKQVAALRDTIRRLREVICCNSLYFNFSFVAIGLSFLSKSKCKRY